MVNFYPLFKRIGSLGLTSIIVALIENKYHIINKIRKRIAVIQNKGTDAVLSLEYKIDKPFDEVVERFKEIFRNDSKEFKLVKKTNTKLISQYKSLTINLIINSQGYLFIEVDRVGCGIKDLKEKINEFLGKIRELERNKTVGEFICCDLTFSLPYKWDNMNIWKPKGLEIRKYHVSFSEENYKSEVEISLNKVNVKSDTIQSLTHIIEKFV